LIQEHAWVGADHSHVVLISLVARYHRRSLPHEEHSGYGELSPGDKARVRVLAGILRVADALDRRHLQRVCDVKVELTPKKLTFLLDGMDSLEPEIAAAKKKGDLLRQEFGGEVIWVAV
jgi:exopolyphosphatase/guanosine-5'-triphosphate,3'-diphosphate pyrophosphatase